MMEMLEKGSDSSLKMKVLICKGKFSHMKNFQVTEYLNT